MACALVIDGVKLGDAHGLGASGAMDDVSGILQRRVDAFRIGYGPEAHAHLRQMFCDKGF